MGPTSPGKTQQRAVIGALLAAGLALGACSDDDASGGSGGGSGGSLSLSLSGTTSSAGSSAGAMTSGGSNDQGLPTEAGGESATVAGSATGGSSIGGSNSSGGNALFLPCASAADCQQFGGGKVCCQQSSMLFCTKPSGCSGNTLP